MPNIESPSLPGKPREALLSVREAARMLGMSPGWLYQSGIRCVKLGRRRQYDPADLRAYIDQHKTPGPRRRAE